MIEHGYNYLDGPIHSVAEFFETNIDILEKSITSSVPSRNKKKSKKGSKKMKSVTFGDSEDGVSEDKKIYQYHGTCRHITDECITLKTLVKQAKQEKGKHFKKKKRYAKHEVNYMVQK